MADVELQKKWLVIEALLGRAQSRLGSEAAAASNRIVDLLTRFEDCLKHNELELALDMLEEIGMDIPCCGGFWRDLERAATEMKLYARGQQHRKQFERALCRGASLSNADDSDL